MTAPWWREPSRYSPPPGGTDRDLNQQYLNDGPCGGTDGPSMAWLDTGTCDSLNDASGYIRTWNIARA